MSLTGFETAANEIRREVDAVSQVLVRYPWSDARKYAAWLAQTYSYVRRVSHVLAAAAARTRLDEHDLHEHFLRAITEEKDHGVLALNDIGDLGFTISDFPEHPLTTAFYQTLFHAIDRAGSVSLLGYFFVLEGVADLQSGRKIYETLKSSYGGRAIRFVEEHVILDADHFPRSMEQLKQLSEHDLNVVLESTKLAGPLYRYMVEAQRVEA